jgi:hypothetical protein
MRWLLPLFARFGTRTLAILCAVLFVIDLVIPDPLPFVDELLLGLATIVLTRRGKAAIRP